MAPNVSRTELDSLLLGQSVETGDYSENPDQTPAKCQSRALPAGLETIDRWMRACVNQFQFTIEELVSGRSVSSAILAASIDEGIHSPFVPAEVMPYLFETGRHAGSLLVRLPQHCAESLASHLSGGSVAC